MKASTAAPYGARLDLADLERRAEWIVQQAQERAAKILADSRAESKRLADGVTKQAQEEGERAGYKAGLERGRKEGRELAHREANEEIALLAAGLGATAQQFEKERGFLVAEARDDLLGLALRLSERITRRRMEVEPDLVSGQVEAAIESVGGRSKLTLVLHPADEEILRSVLSGGRATDVLDLDIQGMVVVRDETMERGGCVLRDGRGVVADATISTQLERITRAILPDGDSEQSRGVAA